MEILKIVFPLLMVAGALGSLVVNIASKGDWATSLQWLGACLLYTALTARNVSSWRAKNEQICDDKHPPQSWCYVEED